MKTYEVSLNNRQVMFDSAAGFKSAAEAIEWTEKHSGKTFNVLISEMDGGEVSYTYHLAFYPAKRLWSAYYYDTWYNLPHEKMAEFFAAEEPGWYLHKNCEEAKN